MYGTGKYQYELIDNWPKLPEGWAFYDVVDIAVDLKDRIYVLCRSAHPVIVFDRDGNFLASWGEELFQHPHGITIGPDGSIYCVDDQLHVVYKFDTEGKLLMEIGNKGQPSDTGYVSDSFDFFWKLTTIKQGGPPFNCPTGVSISPSGEIYVSDGYGNASVHKFSPTGTLLLSWGAPGGDPGQFRLPHFVWADGQERVWVVDRENHRVQIFDNKGKFINEWTDLIRPTDIFIDPEGIVYISELCERISIFANNGTLLSRWGNEKGKNLDEALFVSSHTIAVDSHGDLYVGDVSQADYGIDRGIQTLKKFVRNPYST